ncbi:hypothetical protein AVL62_16195 [Serinicoccus chungangensis]|uniref:CsbD-like domain-containing protein n=1 Tax=Serinicoccus chungangensis TaxID=767452 RepID=A0A0W8I7G6_9MICO|nr:CsbD family protein [Serinicoccus chungangensis]KUG54789.1 hypothetical protein AVL62_16195 [Serinicoccus chungangensis]
MGIGDKMENTFYKAKGQAKESYGEATDDTSMEAEGKTDQAGADLHQGAENTKDTFKDGS